jgi:7-cyano-7-deazaguanine synthase
LEIRSSATRAPEKEAHEKEREKEMKEKVLLSMSGGLDSGVMGQFLQLQGYEVVVANFIYPSKHNRYEHAAFLDLADFFKFDVINIDLTTPFAAFESNLLKSGEAIPEGHYAEESMRQTVVPGRNMIFASFLAGIAESKKIKYVGLAVHAGDHFIYPDCRPAFIENLKRAVECSSDGKVSIMAPFLNIPKAQIVKFGIANRFPFLLARTCYKDQEIACGVCGSCHERQEAFFLAGASDPITYHHRLRFDEDCQVIED